MLDSSHTNIDFLNLAKHPDIRKKFGVKVAGLALLPPAWRLDFAALPVEIDQNYRSTGIFDSSDDVSKLIGWMHKREMKQAIFRSSGVDEQLGDRGRFLSLIVDGPFDAETIRDALKRVYDHAAAQESSSHLGIVVQEFFRPSYAGHLSNEHRVSPTINQWKYEVDAPKWAPSRGLNSKFTTSPDPLSLIRCGNQVPHQPLRSVAHYLVDELGERCHLEWMVVDGVLRLVQLDIEWPDQDTGTDPRTQQIPPAPPTLNLQQKTRFQPYKVGEETRWAKLRNQTDFDFRSSRPAPRIYPLPPAELKASLSSTEDRRKLIDEMIALTGDRLVVRTDCDHKDVASFNLPRTDTMSVGSALDWCEGVISDFDNRGVDRDSYTFLFHAFLPAHASAWAYARPYEPMVIVDALWGLPDGLQVLPVDTYEINVANNTVAQTKSTFKTKYLTEYDDGNWDYVDIKTSIARSQVLSKSDKLELASRTRRIADKLGAEAQIMWFCGVPESYQVGRNVPWFRSREKFDPAPRYSEQYKPFDVSRPDDLDRLPESKVTLRLMPHVDFIRDEPFLDKVINTAQERDLPIRIEGSILGHAFYKINSAGIQIIVGNSPKYFRRRNRQVFGKVVRDKIPANIVSGGESVLEARIHKDDLTLALAGKLIEETEELLRAKSGDDLIGETADVYEVVRGLAKSVSAEWDDVEQRAIAKREKRGGFQDGRVLLETAFPNRDALLEKEARVRLADLGAVQSSEDSVSIPATSLVGTARGPGVIFSFKGSSVRYRASLKDGRLVIDRLNTQTAREDGSQGELFGHHDSSTLGDQ